MVFPGVFRTYKNENLLLYYEWSFNLRIPDARTDKSINLYIWKQDCSRKNIAKSALPLLSYYLLESCFLGTLAGVSDANQHEAQ